MKKMSQLIKKMWQYIQDIKNFFRIAPHLKDNTLYSIVFWYYMIIWFEVNRNIIKKPIYTNVLSILLYFAYGLFLIYNTLYFMKVWFYFIIILELTSRTLKGNQYLFDRLSWVYGPALKNKFGNPWHDTLVGHALKSSVLVLPVVGIDFIAHIPQLHEFTHLQLHGNFDNYTPPGKSMFETAFYSVIPKL